MKHSNKIKKLEARRKLYDDIKGREMLQGRGLKMHRPGSLKK
jgi:hypothetical protein